MSCMQTAICWAMKSGDSFYFLESFHKTNILQLVGAFQDMENFKALVCRIYDLSFMIPPILFLGGFQIYTVWLTLIVLENLKIL